jgi:hypothetical protein
MSEQWHIAISVGFGILGLFLLATGAWTYFRQKKPTFEPEVISDWRPADHIDFVGADDVMLSANDDVPAQFYLCIQEQRLVANISGMPTPEVRWRYATKAEAKEVVRVIVASRDRWRSVSQLNETKIIDDRVPEVIAS